MSDGPLYWGSWKGRVIKAIAIDKSFTWGEVRDITGLSPQSLNQILADWFKWSKLDTARIYTKLDPSVYENIYAEKRLEKTMKQQLVDQTAVIKRLLTLVPEVDVPYSHPILP